MKRVVRLTEKDILNIVKKTIKEQTDPLNPLNNPNYRKTSVPGPVVPSNKKDEIPGGPRWAGGGPGPGKMTEVEKTLKLDGTLFENGIDKIDTNGAQFQKAVNAIKSASLSSLGGIKDVTVIGGASLVGKKQGYDNRALATRRAQNFITAIKSEFPDVNFKLGEPQVGTSEEKNSPQAKSEQFVKLVFTTKKLSMGQAIDHTDVMITGGGQKIQPKVPVTEYVKVCYYFPADIYNLVKDRLKKYQVK